MTYSRSQNLLELLVINHGLSERRNIFVPQWLELSHVLVVLQLAWVRISPQLRWITPSSLALYLALERLSGYLWHTSKWYYAPELRPFLTTRLRQFVRGELNFRISFPVFSKIVIFSTEFKPFLNQSWGILEPKPPDTAAPLAVAHSFSRLYIFLLFRLLSASVALI